MRNGTRALLKERETKEKNKVRNPLICEARKKKAAAVTTSATHHDVSHCSAVLYTSLGGDV